MHVVGRGRKERERTEGMTTWRGPRMRGTVRVTRRSKEAAHRIWQSQGTQPLLGGPTQIAELSGGKSRENLPQSPSNFPDRGQDGEGRRRPCGGAGEGHAELLTEDPSEPRLMRESARRNMKDGGEPTRREFRLGKEIQRTSTFARRTPWPLDALHIASPRSPMFLPTHSPPRIPPEVYRSSSLNAPCPPPRHPRRPPPALLVPLLPSDPTLLLDPPPVTLPGLPLGLLLPAPVGAPNANTGPPPAPS